MSLGHFSSMWCFWQPSTSSPLAATPLDRTGEVRQNLLAAWVTGLVSSGHSTCSRWGSRLDFGKVLQNAGFIHSYFCPSWPIVSQQQVIVQVFQLIVAVTQLRHVLRIYKQLFNLGTCNCFEMPPSDSPELFKSIMCSFRSMLSSLDFPTVV